MNRKRIDDTILKMSVEEKVGQTLMFCCFRLENEVLQETLDIVGKYHLGYSTIQCSNHGHWNTKRT